MNKKLKKSYSVTIVAIILYMFTTVISGWFALISVTDYMINFHNVDLSYNMALISNDLDKIKDKTGCSIETNYREWRDKYGIGENQTVKYLDSYTSGLDKMNISFLKFGLSMMSFGFGVVGSFFLSVGIFEEYKKVVNEKWTENNIGL